MENHLRIFLGGFFGVAQSHFSDFSVKRNEKGRRVSAEVQFPFAHTVMHKKEGCRGGEMIINYVTLTTLCESVWLLNEL